MTRTIIFVSHTGEISGAELVMLQLMRLAHEQGFTVMLACPEGPLRDRARASVDFETVTLPTLSLRGKGVWHASWRFSKLQRIGELPGASLRLGLSRPARP